MKELKFEELTLEQKLGMVMSGIIRPIRCEEKYETFDENLEFVLDLIKNHSLGSVYVPRSTLDYCPDVVDRVKAVADYPILIFTDAESGYGDYQIGRHNALGMADSEELAYIFGKVTAIGARQKGYNVICDPVLDMATKWGACGANVRSLGNDKHKVAKLAIAEARGMRDGGILVCAKHFPSPGPLPRDSHMSPVTFDVTEERLLEYNLFPYLALLKEGLLDGVMATHSKLVNIDPEYPVTLSKKVKKIFRDQGFDGFFISDALDMMSIRAEYGDTDVKGLCVEQGIDFILPWFSARKAYKDLCECYKKGIISDARLDEAVKYVLAAQKKALALEPKYTEITKEDIEKFERINKDGIYAKADEGMDISISKDGKHFFGIIVKNETDINDDGKVTVDTFTNDWWHPAQIIKKIEELFPNSMVRAISQFPTAAQNMDLLQDSADYEDVIMLNFAEAPAYTGSDHITQRMQALINALIISEKLSTVAHFGNPYPLQELMHIPRIIIGGISAGSVEAGLEVLAGNYPAKGTMIYDVDFK